ncbi:hypothetical protein EU537_08410 [Candidatus Thorarchaeota archaeon]|nr:MAG: hypothetical protein EU537_08410 [Candidatus Thorarchaeota archaeon]
MIDDEFDKFVRQMFERFFNGSMSTGPDRDVQIRISTGLDQTPNRGFVGEEVEEQNSETIDLGDKYMILVQDVESSVAPTAHIEGREAVLNIGNGSGRRLKFELPYAVDTENSSLSFRNGIIEIILPKSSEIETSSDTNEITLSAD